MYRDDPAEAFRAETAELKSRIEKMQNELDWWHSRVRLRRRNMLLCSVVWGAICIFIYYTAITISAAPGNNGGHFDWARFNGAHPHAKALVTTIWFAGLAVYYWMESPDL